MSLTEIAFRDNKCQCRQSHKASSDSSWKYCVLPDFPKKCIERKAIENVLLDLMCRFHSGIFILLSQSLNHNKYYTIIELTSIDCIIPAHASFRQWEGGVFSCEESRKQQQQRSAWSVLIPESLVQEVIRSMFIKKTRLIHWVSVSMDMCRTSWCDCYCSSFRQPWTHVSIINGAGRGSVLPLSHVTGMWLSDIWLVLERRQRLHKAHAHQVSVSELWFLVHQNHVWVDLISVATCSYVVDSLNWNFFIWPTRPQIPLKWMCIHFCKHSKGSPVNINPNIENFYALDYTYFWGIWEAAGGQEFVMSSNSFGLWQLSYNTLTFYCWPQNWAQSEEHFAPTNWSHWRYKDNVKYPYKKQPYRCSHDHSEPNLCIVEVPTNASSTGRIFSLQAYQPHVGVDSCS